MAHWDCRECRCAVVSRWLRCQCQKRSFFQGMGFWEQAAMDHGQRSERQKEGSRQPTRLCSPSSDQQHPKAQRRPPLLRSLWSWAAVSPKAALSMARAEVLPHLTHTWTWGVDVRRFDDTSYNRKQNDGLKFLLIAWTKSILNKQANNWVRMPSTSLIRTTPGHCRAALTNQ